MFIKSKIVFHFAICTTFIALPFLITPPHRAEFGSKIGDYLILRKEISNLLLMVFFYFNLYYLLPNLYFKRKYKVFSFYIFLFLLLCIAPDVILNRFTTSKHNFTFFINSQITVFLFLAVFFITYSIKINSRLKEVQIEMKNAQLSFLKGQIHPHFLFNTLNSIYSLAIKNSKETPDAIIKLSGMMRYTLTEIEREFVPLEKEIQFITNYIALQKLRLGKTCTVISELENSAPNDVIIPLIFISFIENAFKFGVSADENAVIKLEIKNNEGELRFAIHNKKLNKRPQEISTEIGISNTKKRLNLLYPNKHQLSITETEQEFSVALKINLR